LLVVKVLYLEKKNENMRSTFLTAGLLFALSLVACKKPKAILYRYDITIKVKDNLSGAAASSKEDTIMAVNDSSAYARAILKVTAQKRSDKMTGNSVYTYQSFSLLDSLGLSVSSRLSTKYKDSVETHFNELAKRMEK
jgi:hypothetical protein